MKESIKRELTAILGPERATCKPEDLVAHSLDIYPEEHRPDIMLFPLTTEEVSAVMKVAYREAIPVVARGAGTKPAGQTVPVHGGIVLAMTRMNKIIEIDKNNRTATVQPGVISFELQEAVGQYGLMYPPDPGSWKSATMGGTVATNAGGPRTLKYGVTRDYLLGLTVVLANGDVLTTGGVPIKNVTGYDLTRLICGSEGTLGIVTEIIARLVPKPPASRTLRADFMCLEDCSDAVAAIIGQAIIPAAMELMDQVVINAVEQDAGLGLPLDVEGLLLIQVDGDAESVDAQADRIDAILRQKGAAAVFRSDSPAETERLWTARRLAFPAMARLRPNCLVEDVTVPVSRLTAMIRIIRGISRRHALVTGVLAHAGNGNLHPLILFDQQDPDELRRVREADEEIFREAVALGGTLSGEHGTGIAKAGFFPMERDNIAISVTRKIKQSFDPKGILNPGKFV